MDDLPDFDSLFETTEEQMELEEINVLFIGSKTVSEEIKPMVLQYGPVKYYSVENIDDAIDQLLREIFAIVFLSNVDQDLDVITVSRIVRVNHPLARIVVISSSLRSLFIADIINRGSVDAYLPYPPKPTEVFNIITENHARHDINKMLTSFVNEPPDLSPASYLLLDPSLSAEEDEPVKFVGVMISYNSVPRWSQFFEEQFLANDEVLFAGYLSGVTMLGKELLKSDNPLKEINFGGISVIFRFKDDIQFSIFVRNLSKHNARDAEKVIDKIISQILNAAEDTIASTDRIRGQDQQLLETIIQNFKAANTEVQYREELKQKDTSIKDQTILFYGTDTAEHRKIEQYLKRRAEFNVFTTTEETLARETLRHENCSVLLLDSDLKNRKNRQNPIDFAEFAKDEFPYLQVIYRMRDRRASAPIIRALNSGAINFLISYNSTRKELYSWIKQAVEKAVELRVKSESSEGMNTALDRAVVAKTIIRRNEETFLSEKVPILDGIFLTKDEVPLFSRFWDTGNEIDFNKDMLAGLVASLDSVSDEMFYDDSEIGGLELGNANILVQHRDDYNFAFFVENIEGYNSKIVNKHLPEFADRLYEVISNYEQEDIKSPVVLARLDTVSNNILSDFTELFD